MIKELEEMSVEELEILCPVYVYKNYTGKCGNCGKHEITEQISYKRSIEVYVGNPKHYEIEYSPTAYKQFLPQPTIITCGRAPTLKEALIMAIETLKSRGL